MSPRPKYTYARSGGMWAVLWMTYYPNGSIGEKVSQHPTREEASAEVYRLNGWNAKKIKENITQK
jgi:hypothetical protein